MPRVLVIGAQGVLGTFVARAMDAAGWQVVRGGRRAEDAGDFRLVDLDRPDTVGTALENVDLTINCVLHPDLVPERTALRMGATLLSIASLPLADRKRLISEAKDAPGLVVLHAGLNPGLSTLVLADLLEAHPDADSVELVNTLSVRQSSGPNGIRFFWPFLTAPGPHPTKAISFPPPLGPRRCIRIGGGEEGWLGGLTRDRAGNTYVCFAERTPNAGLSALARMGLLRFLPSKPFTPKRGRVPANLSDEPSCDWLAIRREGELLAARTVEGRGDYRLTVEATVVFADALFELREKQPERRGALGAEELFTLQDLGSRFEERGIRIVAQPV